MKYHLTIIKTQKVIAILLGHCIEKRSRMALFRMRWRACASGRAMAAVTRCAAVQCQSSLIFPF